MSVREAFVSLWTVMQAKLHPAQHKDCERPWLQHLRATIGGSLFGAGQRFALADRTMPCRTGCKPCLKRYGHRWAFRTQEELERADRARLVTFTSRYEVTPRQFYAELRNFERRVRDKEARKAKREGREPTIFRRIAVMERGEHGTKRVHGHVLYAEHGPPIPRRFYKDRSQENPAGCWLLGWVKTNIVHNDPLKAARYLTKYLTKGNGVVPFPGGRRLAASPFWGPGKPIYRAARSTTREGSPAQAQRRIAAEAARAHRDPTQEGALPSCALLTKPLATPGECTSQTGPPKPPDDWVKSLICGWGESGYSIRLLSPDEIPPEIREKWFAEEET